MSYDSVYGWSVITGSSVIYPDSHKATSYDMKGSNTTESLSVIKKHYLYSSHSLSPQAFFSYKISYRSLPSFSSPPGLESNFEPNSQKLGNSSSLVVLSDSTGEGHLSSIGVQLETRKAKERNTLKKV